MSEQELQAIRLTGFALAMAVAFAWQKLSPHSRSPGSVRVNGGLWVVNAIVTGTICGACVCGASGWAVENNVGLLNRWSMPAWFAYPLSVAFLDLISYAWHRANHALPFLWRWHQVHHADTSFSVSTSLRFHPGELLLSLPLRLAAVVILGAPVAAVVLFEVAFTLANAIEHGDIDIPGRVENLAAGILVTPALHRWHHSIAVPDRDSNFGTIFSVWDRLFGTLAPSGSAAMVRTGIPGPSGATLADALLLPWRRGAN